jgi:hypothetical protein
MLLAVDLVVRSRTDRNSREATASNIPKRMLMSHNSVHPAYLEMSSKANQGDFDCSGNKDDQSTFPSKLTSMKDRKGKLRGPCQSCSCFEFVISRGLKCQCNCLASSHIELDTIPGMFEQKGGVFPRQQSFVGIESITGKIMKKQLALGFLATCMCVLIGVVAPSSPSNQLLYLSTQNLT